MARSRTNSCVCQNLAHCADSLTKVLLFSYSVVSSYSSRSSRIQSLCHFDSVRSYKFNKSLSNLTAGPREEERTTCPIIKGLDSRKDNGRVIKFNLILLPRTGPRLCGFYTLRANSETTP